MKKRYFIQVFVGLACLAFRRNNKLVYDCPFIDYHELIRLTNLKGSDRRFNVHLTHCNAYLLRRCCSSTTPSSCSTTCAKQSDQAKEEETENKGPELLHRSLFLLGIIHLAC